MQVDRADFRVQVMLGKTVAVFLCSLLTFGKLESQQANSLGLETLVRSALDSNRDLVGAVINWPIPSKITFIVSLAATALSSLS